MVKFSLDVPVQRRPIVAHDAVTAPRADIRTFTDEDLCIAYAHHGTVRAAAVVLGISPQSLHRRIHRYGCVTAIPVFTEAEKQRLTIEYQGYADRGRLCELAKKMGRPKTSICMIARKLGLTDVARKRPYVAPTRSRQMLDWLAKNPHPKGATGIQFTDEARAKMGAASKKMWASLTPEQKDDRILRQRKALKALPVQRIGASWKSAWREIGGTRSFYRSRWEANYARYLEWLKARGLIKNWEHEPHTFWFAGIKRGCVSYLPDFRVTENNGLTVYHEVKGWMDDRSKTKIARMAKYHPDVKLVVIDGKGYRQLLSTVGRLVPEWEGESVPPSKLTVSK